MRICLVLLLGWMLIPHAATAQTLEQLAAKSPFVTVDLNFLKRKRALSAYAGTKPYCPSIYWWSAKRASDGRAERGYRNNISREMQQAGFPASATQHCLKNAGFVFRGLVPQPHPKNTRYKRYVQAGVLTFRRKGQQAATVSPVLVETNTFGTRSWAIYDATFKKICTVTDGYPGIKMSCPALGRLKGTARRADNRSTYTVRNAKYDVMVMTKRAPSFVKAALSKM